MNVLPSAVTTLIESLEKLPGIGPKSAARLAYFLLRAPRTLSVNLAQSLVDIHKKTTTCEQCFNVSETNLCPICSDSKRTELQLCVVADPLDVVAIEQSGVFTGKYFVLGGVISPMEGIGPDEIRIKELLDRIGKIIKNIEASSDYLELIFALDPSVEGEATIGFVVHRLKELGLIGDNQAADRAANQMTNQVDSQMANRAEDSKEKTRSKIKITRLARGIPTGADLEYTDAQTLKQAFEGRVSI